MPFAQIVPRPFTSQGVRTYAPRASGVYGISSAEEWIYIGHAGNIQKALLEVFQDPGSALMKKQPKGFVFELCGETHWVSRQDKLVLEYQPAFRGIHSVPAGVPLHPREGRNGRHGAV